MHKQGDKNITKPNTNKVAPKITKPDNILSRNEPGTTSLHLP